MIIIIGASPESDGLYWVRFECGCKAAITLTGDKPFEFCSTHRAKTIDKNEITNSLEWPTLLTDHAESYYRNVSNSVARTIQESGKHEQRNDN